MFGKIKGKLKSIFEKHEEIIEENPDEIKEVEVEVKEKKEKLEPVKKKPITKKEKPRVEEPKEATKKEEKKSEVKKKVEEKSIKEKVVEEPKEEIKEKPIIEEVKEEKKGFFSKVFGKKENKDVEELEEIQDEMLEGAPEEEKIAIKEKTEIKDTQRNKDRLEKAIEKEEKLEKEEILEVKEEPKKEGVFGKAFQKIKSKTITEEDYEKIWVELEVFLLEINIAYEIVQNIDDKLRETIVGKSFDRFNLAEKIRGVLVSEVELVLKDREGDLLSEIRSLNEKGEIAKILILGVNGTGKTTSIAKVVNLFQKNDISVVVAAADTFRAAAIEQLEEHAKKLKFKLIQHKGGSDPAAVAYDAIEHAKAKKLDVALIDTAGRMPNNSNLMLELEKIKRVSGAQLSVFIGDSISGNDLIDQIELFDKIVGIDGTILTKTDTDERPGSIVTAAYSINKPIYYLGIGQSYDDLVKFDAKLVAEKLFEIEED